MPAITLGLAEIEERLQVLRRRLNTATVLHAAFLSVSTVFLVAAALVAVGLRGDVTSFRTATWSGCGLAAAVLLASVIAARRRWVDVPAAAELADQRGQLTDRLTTLVDLRRRPRPSRLAPVLVAQTLALGERWRPQRIAPRRVPRSLFLALLSLMVLTASPLVAPSPPPPAVPPQRPPQQMQAPGVPQELAVPPNVSPVGSRSAAGGAMPDSAAQAAASQTLADAPPPPASPAESAADAGVAMLPDRVRNALRSALHAEQMDQGRDLGAAAAGKSKEPVRAPADDRSGAPRDGSSGRRAAEPGKSAPEHGAAPDAQPHPGDSTGGQSQTAQHNTGDESPGGSAPNAGTGSRPENLLGAATAAGEPGHDGATTFKLTITSFLHAVEEPNKQPGRTDKRSPALGGATDKAAAPALNEQQLRDDALRKAEIPPEYEDIVRRVYSSRALPDDAH